MRRSRTWGSGADVGVRPTSRCCQAGRVGRTAPHQSHEDHRFVGRTPWSAGDPLVARRVLDWINSSSVASRDFAPLLEATCIGIASIRERRKRAGAPFGTRASQNILW